MKVFPALVIIVIVAGFCSAKELGDTSSARCSVKDKFVKNRSNAFEFFRDIRNWRKCGKNIFTYLRDIEIFFNLIPGKICNRTDDCSFWSFLELGAGGGVLLPLLIGCWLWVVWSAQCLQWRKRMPGVIFQDQNFMGMTNNRISTVLDALACLESTLLNGWEFS